MCNINGMSKSSRYAIVFFVAALVFVAANIHDFLRPKTCHDCFFPYGIPFTLYQEGGEGGGAGIVWTGLLADAVIVIVSSVLVAAVWQTLAKRTSA